MPTNQEEFKKQRRSLESVHCCFCGEAFGNFEVRHVVDKEDGAGLAHDECESLHRRLTTPAPKPAQKTERTAVRCSASELADSLAKGWRTRHVPMKCADKIETGGYRVEQFLVVLEREIDAK